MPAQECAKDAGVAHARAVAAAAAAAAAVAAALDLRVHSKDGDVDLGDAELSHLLVFRARPFPQLARLVVKVL